MEIFRRIRDLREDADLTQRAVGEAINVPQRTYAYYESGQRMIPPRVLIALADFYRVSIDYLLERTDDRQLHTQWDITFQRRREPCGVALYVCSSTHRSSASHSLGSSFSHTFCSSICSISPMARPS